MSRDVRPPDYVMTFVHLAASRSALSTPLAVCAVWRPPWLAAVADHPAVADLGLTEALELFASA